MQNWQLETLKSLQKNNYIILWKRRSGKTFYNKMIEKAKEYDIIKEDKILEFRLSDNDNKPLV